LAAEPQARAKNKSKGKAQNANVRAKSRSAMIRESRFRVLAFAFGALPFDPFLPLFALLVLLLRLAFCDLPFDLFFLTRSLTSFVPLQL
jgi:hypothetical protein